MIAIYDNGRSYSDHSMHFVTVEDEAQAQKLLALLRCENRDFSLVAVLAEFRWYEGRPETFWGMSRYVENATVEREWGPRALAQSHREELARDEEEGRGSPASRKWLLAEAVRLEAL